MNALETKKWEMFRLLEIYDGYKQLRRISESLIGCSYSVGYDEGILGKLAYIVDLIIRHAEPSLFDREIDFYDTELAHLLENSEMKNEVKAVFLLGIRD